MLFRRKWVVSFVAGASLVLASLLLAADEPNFTDQQKIDFMQNAKVTASHQVSKGITGPPRLKRLSSDDHLRGGLARRREDGLATGGPPAD